VRTEGTIVSNFVTMAIGEPGACSEPANPLAAALISGGQMASFFAARFSVRHDVATVNPVEAIGDYIAGSLSQERTGPYNFNPFVSLPPAGTCAAYSVSNYTPAAVPNLFGTTPTLRGLDAGSITLSGSGPASALANSTPRGIAAGYLGGAAPLLSQLPSQLFLNPGNFTLAGGGGADIGSFVASLVMPAAFTWIGRDSLSTVNRAAPLTLNWSGVAPGYSVFVAGGGVDLPANASTMFLCLAKPGDTSLTIPSVVLANIPAAHQRKLQSLGALYVGEWPLANPVAFSASGLDSGLVMPAQVLGKPVLFQ
jgi:hypothetical protein